MAGAGGGRIRSQVSERNSVESLSSSLGKRIFHFWCRMRKMDGANAEAVLYLK